VTELWKRALQAAALGLGRPSGVVVRVDQISRHGLRESMAFKGS
jgi:hypothetical protein